MAVNRESPGGPWPQCDKPTCCDCQNTPTNDGEARETQGEAMSLIQSEKSCGCPRLAYCLHGPPDAEVVQALENAMEEPTLTSAPLGGGSPVGEPEWLVRVRGWIENNLPGTLNQTDLNCLLYAHDTALAECARLRERLENIRADRLAAMQQREAMRHERDTARQELERVRKVCDGNIAELNRFHALISPHQMIEESDLECLERLLPAPAENGETGCGECERLHGRSEHLGFLIRDYAYKAHVASESLASLEGAQRKSEADNQYAARSFNLMCEAVGWRNEGS